ncbi:MAG: RagB/SusD family nutrient uptake outer membrane protein [Bacteroidaceae bacterium]|nr:RagB/SusD family nutrient uptake outer membrane protein [Bacteroidaceae bacterium]
MKKRKLLLYTFVATAFLGLTSCSDDDKDKDVITVDTVDNDVDALALAEAAGFSYANKAQSYSFVVETFTSKTTSFEGDDTEAGPLVSLLDVDETNFYIIRLFNRNREAIANANIAIDKIEASKVGGNLTASGKKEAIARAKLYRALAYHALVRLYGEVPLNTSSSSTTKVRSSIDDVYTQIVSDLEAAAADLPETSSLPSVPTKDAAYGLLSRVYLDWGSNPLTYSQLSAIYTNVEDPAVSYTNSRLEKAVEYADKVENHKLVEDFRDIWGKDNETKQVEKILTFVRDGDANGTGNHQTHCSFTFGFDLTAENHLSPSSDQPVLNWDKEDQRRDVSYIVDLYDEVGDSIAHFVPPYTLPRYGKYVDQTSEGPLEVIKQNDLDRIELRYAEVLLNKAEALAILGKNEAAAKVLNKLIERAYKGSTAHDLTTATLEDVKQQWAYEYVYEQKEWFNLARWKNVIKDLKSVANNEYFKEEYSAAGNKAKWHGLGDWTVSSFFAKTYKHLHAKYDNAIVKFYRFPIPLGDSNEDLGITPQNPGY